MLVTLNDIRLYGHLPDSADLDALLGNWSAAAQRYIEANVCRQPIEQVAGQTLVISGRGSGSYRFVEFPVTSVETLEKRDGFAWSELDASAYGLISTDPGVLMLEGGFGSGNQNYRITFTSGYAAENAPADVKQVILEVVYDMYQKSGFGDSRLAVNAVTVNQRESTITRTFKALEPEWRERLKPYRARDMVLV